MMCCGVPFTQWHKAGWAKALTVKKEEEKNRGQGAICPNSIK